MRYLKPISIVVLATLLLLNIATAGGEETSETNARLKQGLKQYPEADTNKDGILTETEAREFLKKLTAGATAVGKAVTSKAGGVEPTLTDVHYGPHERNVMDFWKAKSDQPTPVAVFIHGGGFVSGDKSQARNNKLVQQCLDAGVSFASINYRYRTTAPVPDVLRDCARAIQFIRSKSDEWNVDKTRIASYGGSAGAGTSLWLAFHPDLADASNSDPVLRQSSRLCCAGALSCQFSYDLLQWEKLFGPDYKKYAKAGDNWAAFYGLKSEDELTSPAGVKIRADCDMYGMITKDAPPVFLSTGLPGDDPKDRGHMVHHPKHAQMIFDRCHECGTVAVADLPGLNIKPGKDEPRDLKTFLFKYLKVATDSASGN